MTLPSFLIIGAMKSGTTTLHADLATHPSISTPDRKEPGDLNHDEVLTPEGRAAYEEISGTARRARSHSRHPPTTRCFRSILDPLVGRMTCWDPICD